MAIEGIFYVYAKVADLKRAKQFYGEAVVLQRSRERSWNRGGVA